MGGPIAVHLEAGKYSCRHNQSSGDARASGFSGNALVDNDDGIASERGQKFLLLAVFPSTAGETQLAANDGGAF